MRRLLAFVSTAALIVLGMMFSAVLLVFIAGGGLIAFVYLWWKTRAVRRQMREYAVDNAASDAPEFKGEIIEGEVVRKVVAIDQTIER